MLIKKHWIIVSIVAILSVTFVVYMYSQNYIQFEGGLHIILPAKAPSYVTKSFENEIAAPANVQEMSADTNLRGQVQPFTPSEERTRIVEQPRVFDDIMKVAETFGPILSPFIAFYLFKKKKKLDENVSYDEE